MSPASARTQNVTGSRLGRNSFMSGTPSRLRHATTRPSTLSDMSPMRVVGKNTLLDLDASDYSGSGGITELLNASLTPYADALLALQRNREVGKITKGTYIVLVRLVSQEFYCSHQSTISFGCLADVLAMRI